MASWQVAIWARIVGAAPASSRHQAATDACLLPPSTRQLGYLADRATADRHLQVLLALEGGSHDPRKEGFNMVKKPDAKVTATMTGVQKDTNKQAASATRPDKQMKSDNVKQTRVQEAKARVRAYIVDQGPPEARDSYQSRSRWADGHLRFRRWKLLMLRAGPGAGRAPTQEIFVVGVEHLL